MKLKTAAILSVGTELLLGDIVNTDAAFISRRLAALGINQYCQSVVGDNPERLNKALSELLETCDLVILTGGLGPTYDDLTKETAAALFGRGLVLHEESLERIQNRLSKQDRAMSENNKKQAMLPEGAVVFKNNYGTAPGMAIEDEARGKTAILLPGPPRECEPMFIEEVEPYLRRFADHVLVSRTINIFGMGESRVEEILRPIMVSSINPTLAPYAKEGEVQLRVTASAPTEAEGLAMCDEMIAKVRETEVGGCIYGIDAGSIERELVRELASRRLRIACAESCTGGLCAKRLTDIPGSSAVLDGSIVTYANSVKERFVCVSRETLAAHGAVSKETALEMADGVRRLFSSDIGISTTGIAGPDGGTPEKPVGTVFVAVSYNGVCTHRELHIGVYNSNVFGAGSSERAYIRHISASNALELALRLVRGR